MTDQTTEIDDQPSDAEINAEETQPVITPEIEAQATEEAADLEEADHQESEPWQEQMNQLQRELKSLRRQLKKQPESSDLPPPLPPPKSRRQQQRESRKRHIHLW
jgi:chromosome segregation ATPase